MHPRLIDTLVSHPGIGFVMVRADGDGAVVLGAPARPTSASGSSGAISSVRPNAPAEASSSSRWSSTATPVPTRIWRFSRST